MKRAPVIAVVVLSAAALSPANESPFLLRQPALSQSQIVFHYAGDLWTVARDGGVASRLTTAPGVEEMPYFSPDGQWIAFTGEYDGNVDVFVVAAGGGVPRRLTWHPADDRATGWTTDGKRVLFRSNRASYSRFSQLFTIAMDGVFPEVLPLPMGEEGAYSGDGAQIAYVPLARAFRWWKRYRGGRTTPIWIARLSDSSIERVPRNNSNDFNPMWIGDRIYFLSDRNGPFTLFSYDTRTKKVAQELANSGFDIKSAAAGPGAIVYEQFGSIWLYDLKTRKARQVEISVSGDVPEVRPRIEKLAERISTARISPTGARAVFEARGEIVTVPAEKGDARNLTNTPGAAERDPSWSPDGRWIAYFSEEAGEYELHLKEQTGLGEAKRFRLPEPPTYYYNPAWSPDSKKIAYTDKRLNAGYIEIDSGKTVRVDTDRYDGPRRVREAVWSPDSKWLAYTKQLRNHLRAVFLYSVETGESRQLTDGLSDATLPVFDRDGKHLYFVASTDVGLQLGWRDMSSFFRPLTHSAYVVVLRKDLPSPIAPESDEEKQEEERKAGEPGEKGEAKPEPKTVEKVPEVKIDFENIGQRILALPVPRRNYVQIAAGKAGVLYFVELPVAAQMERGPGDRLTLHKFEMKTRKLDKVVEGVSRVEVSANGEKMLLRQGRRWLIVSAGQAPKPSDAALKLDGLEARVEPKIEWRQMYHEALRIQRDFFYDPNLHGVNLAELKKRYEPFLDNLGSRSDLSYLLGEMMGEFTASHLYIGGGQTPEMKRVPVGLLGADYTAENGRYRFARVYNGENWNPDLRAPLTQPGVNVVDGEYLLAVNGRELRSAENLYSYFEGTPDKQVVIRVGPDPAGAGSRDVTVVPVASETRLRNLAWIEGNRRKVDQLSGGRLGYVYLPDTGLGGYTNFNRYYFAQVDKQGAVIDERFNGGGAQPDYIIDYLRRPLLHYRATRDGEDFTGPIGAIFGPKAMLINEYAGSGGDTLPWYFRKTGIGPLIGKRTWGGLVGGLGGWPQLMDGGTVSPPSVGFWDPDQGEWVAENVGITPDIEVEHDPKAVREGRDPQLEKAVEVLLAELQRNPPKKHQRPPFPDYHRRPGATSGGR